VEGANWLLCAIGTRRREMEGRKVFRTCDGCCPRSSDRFLIERDENEHIVPPSLETGVMLAAVCPNTTEYLLKDCNVELITPDFPSSAVHCGK